MSYPYHAAGTGGGITGRGMDIGIIDDAVRGHEDADSPVIQERNWKWWLSDFLSRRMKDSVLLCIGTRWGSRDLMGMILGASDEHAEDWTHLNFPAISDEGEALVPGLKPLHELDEVRASVPARVWNCLYMGNPLPEEGAFFPSDKLLEYDRMIDPGSLVLRRSRQDHPQAVTILWCVRFFGYTRWR